MDVANINIDNTYYLLNVCGLLLNSLRRKVKPSPDPTGFSLGEEDHVNGDGGSVVMPSLSFPSLLPTFLPSAQADS